LIFIDIYGMSNSSSESSTANMVLTSYFIYFILFTD
jgi:hypothetical protein